MNSVQKFPGLQGRATRSANGQIAGKASRRLIPAIQIYNYLKQ